MHLMCVRCWEKSDIKGEILRIFTVFLSREKIHFSDIIFSVSIDFPTYCQNVKYVCQVNIA